MRGACTLMERLHCVCWASTAPQLVICMVCRQHSFKHPNLAMLVSVLTKASRCSRCMPTWQPQPSERAALPALPCCLQTRAVSEKTQELKAKHASAVTALLQRYKQLRSEVSRYNKALEVVMAGSSGSGGAGGCGFEGEAAGAGGADVCSGRDQ